jgi:Phage integrase, N-terminal SAM-like domain
MAEKGDRVELISEKSGRQLQAQQDATRSGMELVPAVIREAGPKAVESFLCFFACAKSEQTGYVYRSAANHFFRWCGDNGLQLDVLKAGHVAGFFEAKQDEWKTSTAKTYFRSLQLLFKHLEADRIMERSPFVGLELPKRPETESDEQRLAKLRQFLRELDGYDEGDAFFRPGLVAMFPVLFHSMDETKIASVTGIPLEEVETYTGRLRTNRIWREDGKITVDSEDQTETEFALNMVLNIGCAAGVFERVPASEELKTQAPDAATNSSTDDAQPKTLPLIATPR